MSRTLFIGDVHEWVTHPGYRAFCRDIRDKYRTQRTVFMGDIADWHSISRHPKHPDAPSSKAEYQITRRQILKWHRDFPHAVVCIGNHDDRVIAQAASVNIPEALVRKYNETWGTTTWRWVYDLVIDGVYVFHGTEQSGIHPAFNTMKTMCMPVIMGHIHTAAGIKWLANPRKRLFAMDVGCGVDDKAAAMLYGRHMKRKSILACGVMVDGHPYHELMPCGRGEKYHRSRFASATRQLRKAA